MNSFVLTALIATSSGSVSFQPLTIFGVPPICLEVGAELVEAVEENILTKREAVQIYDRCLLSQGA